MAKLSALNTIGTVVYRVQWKPLAKVGLLNPHLWAHKVSIFIRLVLLGCRVTVCTFFVAFCAGDECCCMQKRTNNSWLSTHTHTTHTHTAYAYKKENVCLSKTWCTLLTKFKLAMSFNMRAGCPLEFPW